MEKIRVERMTEPIYDMQDLKKVKTLEVLKAPDGRHFLMDGKIRKGFKNMKALNAYLFNR